MNRKKVLIVVVFAIAMVLVGQLSFAQETNKLAVGVRAAYNIYQDDEINFGGDFDTEYDAAVALSVDFTYFFTNAFSLELSVGHLTTDMDVKVSGFEIEYGELTQIPILLTGRYHFSAGDKLMPYAGLGIGYYLNDMEGADGRDGFFYGAPPGVNAFADDAFGFHLTAGFEYFVTENVALNLDYKYVLLDADIGFDGAGFDEKDSTSLNAFVTGFGVKYYF